MPLDSKAVSGADREFHHNHPELKGRSLTMAPEDAKLRKEWMALYKKHSGGDKKPPVAKQKPADPVSHCPPPQKKSISGRFSEVMVKCGGAGHLEAKGVNLAFGAQASFRIYRTRDLKVLDSPSDTMDVDGLAWKPKRPADHKKGDKYQFDVSADGVSAVSSNQFHFFEYPNFGPDTKTLNCTSGVFGWTGKFDVSLAGDVITVTVKIKLINRNGSKPASDSDPLPAVVKDSAGKYKPVSDADKSSMKSDIEGKLSNKVKLFRTGCGFGNACVCGKPVKIVVQFVESGQHHEVNLFTGSGRANASNWTRVKTRSNSWAHETGHLLGWYDEYTGGATGAAPRWKPNEVSHIMNTGLTVPPEYAWDFRDWFAGKTGETWKAK